MFEKVIDNKSIIKSNEEDIIDLTESIFKDKINSDINYSLKRVPKSMIMRMDLVSLSQYDTDEFTELLLKYNDISNPFTLNYDDIIIIPTVESMVKNLSTKKSKDNMAKLVRNYHRYIDKNKLPKGVGSEVNDIKIKKNYSNEDIYNEVNKNVNEDVYTEANMSKENSNSILMRNGRIYFGTNSNVNCSVDGIKVSDFNIQKLKNEL